MLFTLTLNSSTVVAAALYVFLPKIVFLKIKPNYNSVCEYFFPDYCNQFQLAMIDFTNDVIGDFMCKVQLKTYNDRRTKY